MQVILRLKVADFHARIVTDLNKHVKIAQAPAPGDVIADRLYNLRVERTVYPTSQPADFFRMPIVMLKDFEPCDCDSAQQYLEEITALLTAGWKVA